MSGIMFLATKDFADLDRNQTPIVQGVLNEHLTLRILSLLARQRILFKIYVKDSELDLAKVVLLKSLSFVIAEFRFIVRQ